MPVPAHAKSAIKFIESRDGLVAEPTAKKEGRLRGPLLSYVYSVT